ncbi:MAG TPA: TetR/AcrR family transcriptional regulator, partial [Thermoanaerobaculia bacterium]|nr:TetR/AcrR family transcriptional regulator [Thermoanaerobaculia bacterium]
MRVTAETKEATRQAILEVTRQLLRERGWENVSSREIAAAAGIANGTLFNYFPTKEAIVGALVAEALGEANGATRGEVSVEERLFALIFAGLRRLRPYRTFLPYVIDAILAPAERTARSHDTERIRDEHLVQVEVIVGCALTAVQRHLYWSLYTGIVTFWVRDASPKQEQ